ncbi:MAG: ATP-binding cassette domain-containing protein, partial [Chloroflexi bacterium]|nr:ATP-binding cassette domain-containing protein [Chloroflexota bacterium]
GLAHLETRIIDMNETAIEVEQLRKTFSSVVAVDALSFKVNRGEIFGLLGPNGAGKTTTIRILMDIIKPDSGRAYVLGGTPGTARERVGYLPEERGLYRGLRLDETLVYLGKLKGMPTALARRRALELLERVELGEWSKRKVQELSRGMQQKLQIAASIVHDPDLVILDEPFQGLDPVNVELVKDLIRDLRTQGKAIALSAHEMSQVEALCERILLIDHGKAVLYGVLADIKRRFSPNALEITPPFSFEGWPQVARTETHDHKQLIYLAQGVAPREFLKTALDLGLAIDQFEMASMPLDQIFVSVVKGESHDRQ